MQIETLTLNSFKNIHKAELEFCPKVNCFIGDNGMGKSNLLDAIYYLSYCRSYTGVSDSLVVTRGEDVMFLSGKYLRKGLEEEISAGVKPGERKIFRRGGKEYDRLKEHIGLLPVVLVSPADNQLVEGQSEVRRKYLDMTFAQGDPAYLDALMRYRHALEQRNKMLREGSTDYGLFEAMEMQMDRYGSALTMRRSQKAVELHNYFREFYAAISGGEEATIAYKPSVKTDENLADLLLRDRDRDRILKFTTVGPHRDDLDMSIGPLQARHIASQGQQKTFTVAMRLAQFFFLEKSSGIKPLLLLDDIFDKLDSKRVKCIISLVLRPEFGQIFITDTNAAHIDEMLGKVASAESKVFRVEKGEIS